MNSSIVKPLTYGRFGNFLFQAAAAMGYAWRHGLEYTLPNTTLKPKHNPIYLQHLVNPKFNPEWPQEVLTEPTHAYQELPFKEEWRAGRNIILDGYWQSEKYFKEYRNSIIRDFGFEWKPMPGFVSVHVRRGDYLTIKRNGRFKHPPVPASWLMDAMQTFPGHHFIFFSDDIQWCQSVFGRRKDVTFSVGKSEVQDLVAMSHCEHHICSCSTFSWWGMYLNQNPHKRVVFPKNWFSPGWGGLDTSDIIPEWCERI